MRTKRVLRYYCEFCGKGKFSKSWILKHEPTCYKNPSRVPYEGELTSVRQTGSCMNFGGDASLPSGMVWLEWIEHDKMPSWWPGKPGMIFHDGEWHEVPNYKQEWPSGAHGYAGGAPPYDVWPMGYFVEGEERPLNEFPAALRWKAICD